MDFETSLGLLTAIVALGIAAWAAWTAQQTLKRNAAPQLECFLRPRPSNTVFDFVIINTGSGSAYNVGWKIDADEQDFKAHVLNPGMPLSKEVPFSVIEPGGCRTTLFGFGPSLLQYKWVARWCRHKAVHGHGHVRVETPLGEESQ